MLGDRHLDHVLPRARQTRRGGAAAIPCPASALAGHHRDRRALHSDRQEWPGSRPFRKAWLCADRFGKRRDDVAARRGRLWREEPAPEGRCPARLETSFGRRILTLSLIHI